MQKIAMCGGVAFWETVQPVQARKHGRYSDDDDDDDDDAAAIQSWKEQNH